MRLMISLPIHAALRHAAAMRVTTLQASRIRAFRVQEAEATPLIFIIHCGCGCKVYVDVTVQCTLPPAAAAMPMKAVAVAEVLTLLTPAPCH